MSRRDWARMPTRHERKLQWYNFRTWCITAAIWSCVIALVVVLFNKAEASETESPAYLYVILHDDNSTGERFRTYVGTMDECLKILAASKLPSPNKTGGDYEVMGAMFCGYSDFQRQYNRKWWRDHVE